MIEYPDEFPTLLVDSYREMGYPVEYEPGDLSLWVTFSEGVKTRVPIDREWKRMTAPKSARSDYPVPNFRGTAMRFANGKCRFNTYDLRDDKDLPCIEDYASPVAKQHWKRYYSGYGKDGVYREGPMPFRSEQERLDYEKMTGYVQGNGRYERPQTEHPLWHMVKDKPDLQKKYPQIKRYI